jgi:hypothetical protein
VPVGVEQGDGFFCGAIFGGGVGKLFRKRAAAIFRELCVRGAMFGEKWSVHVFRIGRAQLVCGRRLADVILQICFGAMTEIDAVLLGGRSVGI